MANYYNQNYFDSSIFNYDYAAIAAAIIEKYHPKTVIEFGCGNGDLTKAFADKNIEVQAMDGYANPDFSQYPLVQFAKVDLNDPVAVDIFLSTLPSKFDIAISFEVGEHLDPSVSEDLIKWMTSKTDVVIFSSAILGQGGDGHINCRPREFWHSLFTQQGFLIGDNIRRVIRDNAKVAKWYQHNIIDYYRSNQDLSIAEYNALILRLVSSDSFASSDFYLKSRHVEFLMLVFQLQPFKIVLQIRNVIKKMIGKQIVDINKFY